MSLYLQNDQSSVLWPEPIESTWQLLGGEHPSSLAPKLPHLGLADILFMTTIMNIPRSQRPWGIVTWLAEVFALSRPALYGLSARVTQRLLASLQQAEALLPEKSDSGTIELTQNRLTRTILTAAFPGKMAIRPLQQLIREAFGHSRSVGGLCELLMEAGRRSGRVLGQVDTSPLQAVIVARDETFFQGHPLLLVVDPVSTTILLADASSDRQADTWGAALLVAQDQGATIKGTVEDMARMYPKSQQEAGLDWSVQKDVWHIERDGSQVRRDLERAAFRSTKQVLKVQRQLLKAWDDSVFEQQYIPAVEQEERLYDQHALFSEWLAHLGDALELVDWRSGEIRDRSINEWLLEETLTAMERIDHVRVRKWVKKLRRHQTQLLTSLDWLAEALQAYWEQLAQLPWTPKAQQSFTRLVARCWRLRQAVINGHTAFNSQVQQAEAALQILITDNPQRQHMADRLIELLDAGCRASSLIECINGLLQQFLHNRRAFRNLETLQLYLNLFTLWHNMRVYERGKRKGKSPYQLAGIDLGTDDWLSLIGYPAD